VGSIDQNRMTVGIVESISMIQSEQLGRLVQQTYIKFFMKKYNCIFIFFALVSSTNLFSQENYQKGFFVNNRSDTVKGLIDQGEWLRSPKSIRFKTQNDASSSNLLTPDSIRAFGVEGFNYLSHSIKVKGSNNLQVFLRVLSRGQVTFYEYQRDKGQQYFYTEGNGEPVELIYEKIDQLDGQIMIVEKYKQQLALLGKYVKAKPANFENKIRTMNYSQRDILAFARLINGSEPVAAHTKSSEKSFQFFMGLGLVKGVASYSGNTVLANNATSSSTIAPDFNFGFDFYLNPAVKRTILRLEADYTWQKFTFAGNDYDSYTDYSYVATQNLTQHIFSISGSIFFSVHNSKNLRIFLGPSIRDNICSYPDNFYLITVARASTSTIVAHQSDNNYGDWKKNWFSFPANFGVLFKQKYEVNVSVIAPTTLSFGLDVKEALFCFRVKCFL
jgi:hypothetical protein